MGLRCFPQTFTDVHDRTAQGILGRYYSTRRLTTSKGCRGDRATEGNDDPRMKSSFGGLPVHRVVMGHLQERIFRLIILVYNSAIHALSIQNYQYCVFSQNCLFTWANFHLRSNPVSRSACSAQIFVWWDPKLQRNSLHHFRHRLLCTPFMGLCPFGIRAPHSTRISSLIYGKHPIACLNYLPSFSKEPLKITSWDWHMGKLFWTVADVEKSVFEIVSFKRLWLFRCSFLQA